MAVGSKSFPQDIPSESHLSSQPTIGNAGVAASHSFLGISPISQVAIGYGLLIATLWTPSGPYRSVCMILACSWLLLFTFGAACSRRELGLGAPSREGASRILAVGLIVAGAIPLIAILAGQRVPANPGWPPVRDVWQYVVWAMAQQFILQSFFYVRLESALGGQRAVLAATVLFAAAHLPNLVLTAGTFVAALFFCEMFRRYRSIYPLGLVHAALGLALAESIPDHLIHHLRVGIGYLHFHVH